MKNTGTLLAAFTALFMLVTTACKSSSPVASNGGFVEKIANSYSARTFIEKEVSKNDIETILKCGSKAPSAMNAQPWHFTVVRDETVVMGMLRGAAKGCVIIVISGPAEEREGMNVSFDTALATQNMYLTAQDLGLGARILTGPLRDMDEAGKAYFQIPAGLDAIAFLAVGHVGADAISAASPRKSLNEMVNYAD